MALGFDRCGNRGLSGRGEISDTGTEGFFNHRDVELHVHGVLFGGFMDDKEKPITDKKNFPGPEPEPASVPIVVVPIADLAYLDGRMDGYRKAMLDIMIWSVLLLIASAIVAKSRGFSSVL